MKRKDKILRLLKNAIQKEEYALVTFDFDGTLARVETDDDFHTYVVGPDLNTIEQLVEHKTRGSIVCIVTSRSEGGEQRKEPFVNEVPQRVLECAKEWDIYRLLGSDKVGIPPITFTNSDFKDGTLRSLANKVSDALGKNIKVLHYENDEEEILEINKTPGINVKMVQHTED